MLLTFSKRVLRAESEVHQPVMSQNSKECLFSKVMGIIYTISGVPGNVHAPQFQPPAWKLQAQLSGTQTNRFSHWQLRTLEQKSTTPLQGLLQEAF
jgi:hypothetical protein